MLLKCMQILDSTDEATFREAVAMLEETVHLAGCSALAINPENKVILVNTIVHFLVIDRASVAIEQ